MYKSETSLNWFKKLNSTVQLQNVISLMNRKYERVLKNLSALKDKERLLVERDTENLLKVKEMDDALEKFKENARKQVAL